MGIEPSDNARKGASFLSGNIAVARNRTSIPQTPVIEDKENNISL
jgi:hypothetical protein